MSYIQVVCECLRLYGFFFFFFASVPKYKLIVVYLQKPGPKNLIANKNKLLITVKILTPLLQTCWPKSKNGALYRTVSPKANYIVNIKKYHNWAYYVIIRYVYSSFNNLL